MTEIGYNVGFKLVHVAALQRGVFNLFAAPVGLYRGYSSGVLHFDYCSTDLHMHRVQRAQPL